LTQSGHSQSQQKYQNFIPHADALAAATKQEPLKPDKLIPAIIEHFMATDRGFAKARKQAASPNLQKTPWGGRHEVGAGTCQRFTNR